MGAIANMAGDYFKALVVGMPFVDVINTMIGAGVFDFVFPLIFQRS
jgi:protease II